MSAELRAGWSRADITPPLGIHMGGYWGRTSGSTHVHDRLQAKALVLSDSHARVALIALDTVALAANDVRIIRERITAAVGIPPQAVMVCCTHTHAGPLTLAFRGMGEVDTDYMACLIEAAAAVVVAAAETVEPATLRYARASVQIGSNRRHPNGPISAGAHALEIVAARRTAILFSHACHPVVLGADNHGISAEFPGAACEHMEECGISAAMFVNGACGDINPSARGSHQQVVELGQQLGKAVLEALDQRGSDVTGGGVGLAAGSRLPAADGFTLPPAAGRTAADAETAGADEEANRTGKLLGSAGSPGAPSMD